jgi:hypothetical protein
VALGVPKPRSGAPDSKSNPTMTIARVWQLSTLAASAVIEVRKMEGPTTRMQRVAIADHSRSSAEPARSCRLCAGAVPSPGGMLRQEAGAA